MKLKNLSIQICFIVAAWSFGGKNIIAAEQQIVHRGTKRKLDAVATSQQYPCTECDESFVQGFLLLDHVKKTHIKINNGIYSCNQCGHSCDNGSNFNKHLKAHMGIKPYSCNICGWAFGEKYQVRKHLRVHNGEKPYRKTKLQKSQLRKKEKEASCACGGCAQTFSSSSSRNKHERKNVCGRVTASIIFKRQKDSAKYRKAIVNKHPYACEQCGKRFSQKEHSEEHEAMHALAQPQQFVVNVQLPQLEAVQLEEIHDQPEEQLLQPLEAPQDDSEAVDVESFLVENYGDES